MMELEVLNSPCVVGSEVLVHEGDIRGVTTEEEIQGSGGNGRRVGERAMAEY